MDPLVSRIRDDLSFLCGVRHDLHAHPELGYEEHRTSAKVAEVLAAAGVEHRAGLAGGTGVLAWLPSTRGDHAPTVALRADMDALPIEERTGKAYASTAPGKMHACGHDGHTTVMLGVARALAAAPERPNHVLMLFQPAEEGGAGGKRMCEDGALSGAVLGRRPNFIYGLHGFPHLRVGEVATRIGPMMASADRFEILVRGRGGHAALPNSTIDPVLVGAHIITALQSIASRNVDPLDSVVVTVAQIHAGTTDNVIPETASLTGTLRALKGDTRAYACRRIGAIAESVAQAFGATAEYIFKEGYPVTSNDAGAVDRLRDVLSGPGGVHLMPEEVPPVMGAEDFSFYGEHVPACFYWLGLLDEGQHTYPNLHAPEFDFNDRAIPVGVEAMCRLALAPV